MHSVIIDQKTGEVLNAAINLPIVYMRLDGGTQSRAILDEAVVEEYAEAMQAGAQFPPANVIHEDGVYWVWDGFHRIHAAMSIGLEQFPCLIEEGTLRDAILKSCGANPAHGLRRTNADKKKAVTKLLLDEEWSQWSDRQIARQCHVSHDFVSRLRTSLSLNDSENERRSYITKHGTTATMNVSGRKIAQDDDTFVKPAVPAAAPEHLSDAVDYGITSPVKAVEYTSKLDEVSDWTRHVQQKHGVVDPDTLDILEHLRASRADSCVEIEMTGFIQPGEEHEAVHISEGARKVQEALKLKSKTHARLNADEKPLTLVDCVARVIGTSGFSQVIIEANPEAINRLKLAWEADKPIRLIVREEIEA